MADMVRITDKLLTIAPLQKLEENNKYVKKASHGENVSVSEGQFEMIKRLRWWVLIISLLMYIVAPYFTSRLVMAQQADIYKTLNSPLYDPNSSLCVTPTVSATTLAGTSVTGGSSSSLTFPTSLTEGQMINGIKQYIPTVNTHSVFLNDQSTIPALVASAKQAKVNPFLAIAITQEEDTLGDPGDPNIINASNGFGREALPSQPHWQGRYLWYKWSSIKASVDYTAQENQGASGGGDELSYLRVRYGTSIDAGNIHDTIKDYAPHSQNDTIQYIKDVTGFMAKMTQLSGGSAPTEDPVAGNSCACTSLSTSALGPATADGHILPAATGTSGNEESINDAGQVPSGGTVTFSQNAKLGQAFRDYYINMRWRYVKWNWDGTSVAGPESVDFYSHAPRVLVTNPRTHKSIISAILEAGPAPWVGVDSNPNNNPKQGWANPQDGTPPSYTGLVSGFPPTAAHYLDYIPGYGDGGDKLIYSWAPDQNATPGPVSAAGDTLCDGTTGPGNGAGPLGWALTGVNAMVGYDQGDPKWADHPYGTGKTSIAEGGCGIASLAMIIATLTNNKSITPLTLANKYGDTYHVSGGTSWALWPVAARDYNLKEKDLGLDFNAAADIVKSGGLVIASATAPSHFTGGGHLLVIRAVTANGEFLFNDPNGQGHSGDSETRSFSADFLRGEGGIGTLFGFTK